MTAEASGSLAVCRQAASLFHTAALATFYAAASAPTSCNCLIR